MTAVGHLFRAFARWIPGVCALLILSAACRAQPSAGVGSDSGAAFVRITGEPGTLRVYSDTAFLGTTPFESGPLPPGIFRFRVFGADPSDWFPPQLADSIRLEPGATTERHVVLPRVVNVTSEPPGAEVRLGDLPLGTTPLYASLPRGAVALALTLPGYDDLQLLVPGDLNRYHAVMRAADPAATLPEGALRGEVEKSATPVIVAISVAAVSGVASAYLKTRADTYYEDYRLTRDGATLDRVRRFDLLAGISLGVTQLSLGYLVVELLSR